MPEQTQEQTNDNPFKDFKSVAYRDGVEVKDDAGAEKKAGDGGGSDSVATSTATATAGTDGDTGKDGKVSGEAAEGDEAADDTEETGDKKEETPKQKPKKDVNTRIAELTRARRDAERRAADAEARIARLERGEMSPRDAELTGDTKRGKGDTSGKPDPKDYEYGELDSEYIADVAKYGVRQELAAEQQRQDESRQRAAAEQEAQERANLTRTVAGAGEEKYDDFRETVIEPLIAKEWEIPDVMFDMAINSEVGADILYHFATHPEERKVFGESLSKQAAAFGRLAARFSADKADDKPKTETKRTTLQPPPKTQPRGAGGQFAPNLNGEMSFADFEKAVNAKLRA